MNLNFKTNIGFYMILIGILYGINTMTTLQYSNGLEFLFLYWKEFILQAILLIGGYCVFLLNSNKSKKDLV